MNVIQDTLDTLAHSLVAVTLLFVFVRLVGKKQVSELTIYDYVSGIAAGSVAAAFAVDERIRYVRGITALAVFALFPLALSLISLKSYRGCKLLDGTPTVLIQNGSIIERNLARTKLTVNDLLEECRLKNAFDIAEVEYAILETSGKLSLLLKSPNQPLTPKDMNLPTQYKGLCVNLIIDGKILFEHLAMAQKDMDWLLGELKNQNAPDIRNILLAYLDTSNQLHIHMRGNEPPVSPLV